MLAAACRDRPSGSAGAAAGRPAPDSATVQATIVQVAALSDSAGAQAMADSLAADGWTSRVESVQSPDGTRWRVRLAIPGDLELARFVAHALRTRGSDAVVTAEVTRAAGPGIAVYPVNRGTRGMAARVRWTLTPDKRALLVVEDPAGVENDPLPDGFMLAIEQGAALQRDSVWDVTPSPDWTRVAYARAYTTPPGERDSLTPNDWHQLAGQVGLPESLVRENAFPTSGMAYAYGAARPFVVDLATDPPTSPRDTTRDRGLAVPEGWRVRWTRDGARLALGAPPERISDEGQSPRWRLVDPASGEARGTASEPELARVQWNEGPTLDISTVVDTKQRRAFRAGAHDVESEDGWIRVYSRGASGLRTGHRVGPGIALSVTANGEYIAALAPNPQARSYEASNQLVVYHVRP